MRYAEKQNEERNRISEIKERATPPFECGSAMPVSPARGPMVMFNPREMVQTETGGVRSVRTGYLGRSAARLMDVFEQMELQARRSHSRAVKLAERKNERPPPFEPPFSPGQISVARDYAALTERCASAGLKCSSIEGSSGGGSSPDDRLERTIEDGKRLAAYHRRIGVGVAKEVRRRRPSTRGANPHECRNITDRELVDMVCLSGLSLAAVLKKRNWANGSKNLKPLGQALRSALDRMQGYQDGDPRLTD